MSVLAELDRDADLIMREAEIRLNNRQAEIDKLKKNFKSLRQWVDNKLCELDATDGYNYDNGVDVAPVAVAAFEKKLDRG